MKLWFWYQNLWQIQRNIRDDMDCQRKIARKRISTNYNKGENTEITAIWKPVFFKSLFIILYCCINETESVRKIPITLYPD